MFVSYSVAGWRAFSSARERSAWISLSKSPPMRWRRHHLCLDAIVTYVLIRSSPICWCGRHSSDGAVVTSVVEKAAPGQAGLLP